MKIAIISEQNHVAIELGTCLKGSGHNVSIETRAEAAGYSLEVREGLEPASIDAIHSAILPFSPPISISRELDGEGIDARLSVGGTDSTYDAYVAGAIEDTTREVCNLLGTVSGLRIKTAEPAWTESDVVAFGPEIPPQIRHWVLFQLHRSGRAPIVTTNGVAKDALAVIMRSASDDPTKGVVVELHCDCPNATAHLVSDGLAGFKVVPGSRSPKPRFQLDLGPLCSPSLARHRLALEQATWAVIADAGIDSKVHPLKVKFVKDPDVPIPAKCVIHLPLAAWQRGEIRPMTGDIPSRFDIELRVDEPGAEAPLREALAGQGFSVAVAPGRAVASDGFSVHWGIAEKCPVQKARVTDTLRSFLDRLSLPGGYRLDEQRGDKKSPTVTIYLPIAAARGGSLPDRRGAGYRFRLISVKAHGWDESLAKLNSWGFDRFSDDSGCDSSSLDEGAVIRFGGAPRTLIEDIGALFRAEGIEVRLQQDWGDHDPDIWVYMPARPKETSDDGEDGTSALSLTNADTADSESISLPDGFVAAAAIEVTPDVVRIGRFSLPRRADVPEDHALLPKDEVEDYCIDRPTFANLEHVAASVALREPVLLEGDTSTSKTSVIQYLAKLVRQPMIRVNMSSHTDPLDLLGRWVPGESGGFRYVEGPLPFAMKNGIWAVFDEVNLASSGCLERLNAALERHPSLLLNETDGSRIAGEAVHPAFRIFATMNPASYSGRSVLSPAWRNRFSGYRWCQVPSERDFEAMLRYWVYGDQPVLKRDGARIQGPAHPRPQFATLARFRVMPALLTALARFHCSVIGLTGHQDNAGAPRLGAIRKERYVFTRRNLFDALKCICAQVGEGGHSGIPLAAAVDYAVTRYYIEHMESAADRATIRSLEEAHGLLPEGPLFDSLPDDIANVVARHSLLALLASTMRARVAQMQTTGPGFVGTP